MGLALSGLSGLSGFVDGAASVTPDPGAGEKYWANGLPFVYLRGPSGTDGQKYWADGLPYEGIAPA